MFKKIIDFFKKFKIWIILGLATVFAVILMIIFNQPKQIQNNETEQTNTLLDTVNQFIGKCINDLETINQNSKQREDKEKELFKDN